MRRRNKKRSLRIHARKRFRERVGAVLTDERRRSLIKAIQEGRAELVERQSLRVRHYRIGINEIMYRVIYDANRKEIVTVLFEFEEKGETMQTVEQTLAALRPREKADLQKAMEAFKDDMILAEGRLDTLPENNEEFEANSSLANRLNHAHEQMNNIRLNANRPHRASIEHNDNLVNPILQKVKNFINVLRGNNDAYKAKMRRLQAEEEAKARAIEEGRRKAQETRAAKGMNVKPVEELAPVARPIDFKQMTSVTLKRVWEWQLEDYDKVSEDVKKDDWRVNSIDGNKARKAGRLKFEAGEYTEDDEGNVIVSLPGIKVIGREKSY